MRLNYGQINLFHTTASRLLHHNACYLLYNSDLLTQPDTALLNEAIFQQADSCQKITVGGRGQAWFIDIFGLSTVLRCYQRGGLVARFNQQSYLGVRPEHSRAFREWRLLEWMHGQGLPVPQPVAASVCRWPFNFSPLYRARILIQRIADTQTLDYYLGQQPMDHALWRSIGGCIRVFHNQGIYHADLNANNILLDTQQRVYLIDFDKAEQRMLSAQPAQWKTANLQRLKRSLLKQQGLSERYYFREDDWQVLVEGYEES
ncbi:hypothetical protein MNBD_GAMMA09-2911 [hydrothermal vent metagenome]|uniref:3-deoxy-D-manno-octulosonic acid kinase n=1 Tax=hydrothermal vent metagenome TaxID=652676 RepID=A0A3B0Y9K4_9ZZZZ